MSSLRLPLLQSIREFSQCSNNHVWKGAQRVEQTTGAIHPCSLHASGSSTNNIEGVGGDQPNLANGTPKPVCHMPIDPGRRLVYLYLVDADKPLEILVELRRLHNRIKHRWTTVRKNDHGMASRLQSLKTRLNVANRSRSLYCAISAFF